MYWGLCVGVTFTAYPVFLTCFSLSCYMFQGIWGEFHPPDTCFRISRVGFIPDPCFRISGVCFNLLMLCNQGYLDYYKIVTLSILFMFFIGRMIVVTKACLVFYG